MDPAGSFPQPVAGLAGFALQHHDLARAFSQLHPLRAQSAGVLQAGIDPPFCTELADILAGGNAGLAEVHGGIKADPAASDNRHLLAYRRFIAQDIEVAQHFGMLDPGDIRHPRGDPGGEDDFIKCPQIPGRDVGIQSQIDSVKIEHLAIVAQGFVELLFAGDLLGDIKLAANLAMTIKKGNLMSARGGVNRKGQPGRTSADHRQPLRRGRGRYRHQGFMAGARVDQARGDLAGEDPIEAGLVAADAGIDLFRPSALCFGEKFAVGEERAGH